MTLPDGGVLWAEVGGEVLPAGAPTGWRVSGLLRDVTERRQADERQVLMTRELDHRAKNALAVVLAALRLTPASDPRAYAAAVEGRVGALARAHTLLTQRRWTGADLHDLVCGERRSVLPAAAAERFRIEGPAVLLAAQAAQPLSIALHELATNAARHGALSGPRGQVEVTWSIERDSGALRLTWRETGGPAITGAAEAAGLRLAGHAGVADGAARRKAGLPLGRIRPGLRGHPAGGAGPGGGGGTGEPAGLRRRRIAGAARFVTAGCRRPAAARAAARRRHRCRRCRRPAPAAAASP